MDWLMQIAHTILRKTVQQNWTRDRFVNCLKRRARAVANDPVTWVLVTCFPSQ